MADPFAVEPSDPKYDWTKARVLEVEPPYIAQAGDLVGKEIEGHFEHSTPKTRFQIVHYKQGKEVKFMVAKVERILDGTI